MQYAAVGGTGNASMCAECAELFAAGMREMERTCDVATPAKDWNLLVSELRAVHRCTLHASRDPRSQDVSTAGKTMCHA